MEHLVKMLPGHLVFLWRKKKGREVASQKLFTPHFALMFTSWSGPYFAEIIAFYFISVVYKKKRS